LVFFSGQTPLPNGFRIPQSGLVGGFEVGYNWQAGSNWLLGIETDFSFSGMSGTASGPTSFLVNAPSFFTVIPQSITANESTDWYGTVRGRLGRLATPNLLLFGTGGFAYGRVADSANYALNSNIPLFAQGAGGFGFLCATSGVPCFTGSSSAIRTGWTVGGGVEWLLDQHWSVKIEYQFVDLGTETVRVTAVSVCATTACTTLFGPTSPSSFNAVFPDRFNVVRVGMNYRFW
jgi:outer membrane immunogenic protein